MDEHSLREYFQKQPTETLEHLLNHYLQEYNYINYEHAILEILQVLEERFVPDLSSENMRRMRERLLQYKPKDDPDSQEQS